MYRKWFSLANCLDSSPFPWEAECIKLGDLEANNAPFLVPEALLDEHLYAEGPSGSGKTTGVLMALSQMYRRPNRSFVLIDMKADTNEILATSWREGLRWFIDRVGSSSFTWNLFEQRYWARLTPLQKASTLAAALGTVTTMAGYGVQYFQGSCHEVLQRVFERAEVKSFRGLAEAIHHLIIHGKRDDIHSDIRAAGLQAYLDVRRVGSVQALNTIGNPGGIDLCSLFETQQILYIALPSAGNHALAGVIARLFIAGLFEAAASTERKMKVTVLVDEWQRAVAPGILETTLTQARSMGISFWLANQTIQDLNTKDKDYRATMLACCRCHWLFGLGTPAEQEAFARTSGFAEVAKRAKTYGWESGSWGLTSYTDTKDTVERYTLNEVKRICADPRLSFFTSSGNHGMYQYGAFPQAIRTEFHIEKEQYEQRKAFPWPEPGEGCIVTEMPSAPDEPEVQEPPPITTIGRPKPQSPKPRRSKE